MRDKVEEAINELRGPLRADGGDVELIDVTDRGIVKVKLQGACAGCPMSTMTLNMGIEKVLKQNVPEIVKVESI